MLSSWLETCASSLKSWLVAGNLDWFENSGLPCWVKDYVDVLYQK